MKPKAEVAELIEHWYVLVAGQHFSTKDFYYEIETRIKGQEVPGITINRIDLAEGGLLSDKREYLRMKRERLVFDICGAPVGTNYFFSYRFYLEPIVVSILEVIAVALAIVFLFYGSVRFIGPLTVIIGLGVLVWAMRNAVGMGLRDLDTTLTKIPALGPIYERYFRKDTYYRQDTRIAYCSIVSALVKQEADKLMAKNGVLLYREYVRSPLWADLYDSKDVKPKGEQPTS